MWRSLKCLFRVLVTPSYWLQNNEYSREWDRQLNYLLTTETFRPDGPHTAMLGKTLLWTSNHPYASFTPYGCGLPKVRPRRSTICRAWDKYQHDLFADISREREEVEELRKLYPRG